MFTKMNNCKLVFLLMLLSVASLICLPDLATTQESVFNFPTDIDNPTPSFRQITEQLSKVSILRGNFEQQKQIAHLKRPLTSTGTFLLHKTHGLVWLTKTPFNLDILVTDQGIFQYQDNQTTSVVPTGKQPIITGFAQAFIAAFSGELSAIEKTFTIYFTQTPGSWQIGLIPKDRLLNRFIKQLILRGSDIIDQIEITEANEDITRIKLLDTTQSPSELNHDEKKYFPHS